MRAGYDDKWPEQTILLHGKEFMPAGLWMQARKHRPNPGASAILCKRMRTHPSTLCSVLAIVLFSIVSPLAFIPCAPVAILCVD
jgi:hypothetical protein